MVLGSLSSIACSSCAGLQGAERLLAETEPVVSAGESNPAATAEPRPTASAPFLLRQRPNDHSGFFGIATSASSARQLSQWLPDISAAGVRWLRGFDVSSPERGLAVAASLDVQVAGILMWRPDGQPLAFPVADLPGWSKYVSQLVQRCQGRVKHWEVWNEPPNFTADKSPASYAKTVVAAYDAAKRVDPTVQIGLAAQSNNVHWLDATLSSGAQGHFDYVTVHPYEILDTVAQGGEAMFMSIVPTLRRMLRARDPASARVPIWFTELGQPVNQRNSPQQQATALVKTYVMGMAQGVERIHWFEGKDGDSGPFGLLDQTGAKRPSYTALATLTQHLGAQPKYHGWLQLAQTGYGFVFSGSATNVLVAWTRPGSDARVDLDVDTLIVDPLTGSSVTQSSVNLTGTPLLVLGVPLQWVAQAEANFARPFPWGGDYSDVRSVSLSAPDVEHGLHQFAEPRLLVVNGETARDASQAKAQPFAVDPNFLSYTSVPIRISVVVRRNGEQAAGFNLKYESTSGWKSSGSWYTIPEGRQWVEKSFTITDSQFAGKWGYQFALDSDATRHSQYSIRRVTVTKL